MTTKSTLPYRRPQVPLLPRIAAAIGIVVFAAGSLLVFLIPSNSIQVKAVKPELTPVYSDDPVVPHDLLPKKVSPSKTSSISPKPTPQKSVSSVVPKSTGSTAPREGGGHTSPIPKTTTMPTPKPVTKPSVVPSVRPTPTPTRTQPPSVPSNDVLRTAMISQINQTRTNFGLSPLQYSSTLSQQSQTWSTHMADIDTLVHSYNGYGGEIIASGAYGVETALRLWLNSPPHKAIMLGDYNLIGAGYVDGYWTVQFN